jgi:hypothetical protein
MITSLALVAAGIGWGIILGALAVWRFAESIQLEPVSGLSTVYRYDHEDYRSSWVAEVDWLPEEFYCN